MKTQSCRFVFILFILLLTSSVTAQTSSSAISYQGTLDVAGVAADGVYDFRAVLYDDIEFGNQTSAVLEVLDVQVVNGLVNLSLDFGNEAGTDEQRFLQLEVREASSSTGFTRLDPRQELFSSPTALNSKKLNGETFQRGVVGDCSVPISTGATGNVTFPKPFSAPPLVFLSPDISRDQVGCVAAAVKARDENGFSWATFDLGGPRSCDCLPWLAIGPI